jgi:hypothetical protein
VGLSPARRERRASVESALSMQTRRQVLACAIALLLFPDCRPQCPNAWKGAARSGISDARCSLLALSHSRLRAGMCAATGRWPDASGRE